MLKMQQRLNGWHENFLSAAGRIILVKFVLQSLPIYFLSLYPIPLIVLQRLNGICARFVWGGTLQRKKIHKIAWPIVFSPRKFGGLGCLDINLLNPALLSEWIWRLSSDLHSSFLWCILSLQSSGMNSYLSLSPPSFPRNLPSSSIKKSFILEGYPKKMLEKPFYPPLLLLQMCFLRW